MFKGKIIHRILLPLMVLLICIGSAKGEGSKEKTAKELLETLREKIDQLPGFSIDFSFRYEKDGETLYRKGRILFSKERYHLRLEDMERIFDGKYVYTILPDVEEVNIEKPAEAAQDIPVSLGQMLDRLLRDYQVRDDIRKPFEGRTIRYLRLDPIDKTRKEYLLIGIEPSGMTLHEVIEVSPEGNSSFQVEEWDEKNPPAEKEFIFDRKKYTDQGYYIVEP